jgi:hypothetical protein
MTRDSTTGAAGAPEASTPGVTLLEFPREGGYPERMTAALEYMVSAKVLRLVTLLACQLALTLAKALHVRPIHHVVRVEIQGAIHQGGKRGVGELKVGRQGAVGSCTVLFDGGEQGLEEVR